MRLRSAIFILALCLGLNTWADGTIHLRTTKIDDYFVTYWTSEQGIPQNTVDCLLQSRNGYIWAGTRYGLVRFDGVNLSSFIDELGELDPDCYDVRGIAEDPQGRLVLRTRKGIAMSTKGRFELLPFTGLGSPNQVHSICPSQHGDYWVIKTDSVLLFKNGEVIKRVGLNELSIGLARSHGELLRGFEDSTGDFWVLVYTWGGPHDWQRFSWSSQTVTGLSKLAGISERDTTAMFEEKTGKWWIGRPGELLLWENNRVIRFDASKAWGTNLVSEITVDLRGNLWVRSEGEIQIHRFANGQFTSYGRNEGITDPSDVRCLLPDREGNLWVGTGRGGLIRLQPRQMVSALTGSASASDEVFSISSGQNGRVWMATTYGLVLYQSNHFEVFTNSHGLIAPDIRRIRPVLEDHTGQVWYGLDYEGLQTLQEGILTRVKCPEIKAATSRLINSLLEDQGGTLWIGTPNGVLEKKESRFRFWTTNDGLSDNAVFGLIEGVDGSIWAGTVAGGINQLKNGKIRAWLPRDGLLSANVWPLRAEPDGTLWVGTPRGLNRIRNGQIRSVTVTNGLYENLAYCLLEDRFGNYWTYGNRGIWRMKKSELNEVADGKAQSVFCVNYGEADGMVSTEGNGEDYPNAAALPNGELWFPTTRGVVIVNPEKLRDNNVPPIVVIEEVRVDDELVYKDGGFFHVPNSNGVMKLAAGRARVMEIRYTANTFIDSEKVQFRCQLEGADETWHEAGQRRIAIYTNLRPGNYRFRVLACNHHGFYSQMPAEFAFNLAPHFYQTWYFYIACGVAAIGAVIGWHNRRVAVLRRIQSLEQQQALHNERGRIAKDLHDDLGASLTGIALELDLARREVENSVGGQNRLGALAHSARALVDRMREVVWTINPMCDTLESFCIYICDYAENYLANAGLRCRLEFPVDIPATELSADWRHQLFLVAKEALHNAVKHSGGTEVRITLKLNQNSVLLTIEDNGRGLKVNADSGRDHGASKSSGQGLMNMRKRVESLGGKFQLEGREGTWISVDVPLPK